MIVGRIFTFNAAHYLPGHPKCGKLHGHTYKMEIIVSGPVQDDGMTVDFGWLKELVQDYVMPDLDHALLNDSVKMPTAENLCVYVWNVLRTPLETSGLHLAHVKIWETESCYAATNVGG